MAVPHPGRKESKCSPCQSQALLDGLNGLTCEMMAEEGTMSLWPCLHGEGSPGPHSGGDSSGRKRRQAGLCTSSHRL